MTLICVGGRAAHRKEQIVALGCDAQARQAQPRAELDHAARIDCAIAPAAQGKRVAVFACVISAKRSARLHVLRETRVIT